MPDTTILMDGLHFAECPRWHDGKLWFSDMRAHCVRTLDLDGTSEVVVEVVPNRSGGVGWGPGGLGWGPDGSLLVVAMTDRRLLRFDGGQLTEVADLSPQIPFGLNDMVVDAVGRAYIGNFGFDPEVSEQPEATSLMRVDPDGSTSVAADDLIMPNGVVITPDGTTLIVAETSAAKLTAFDVAPDGALSNRRDWAVFDGEYPDGICLDAEGALWVSAPTGTDVLRVREGGEITARVSTSNHPLACMLGGPERRHLFVCTLDEPENRTARIEVVEVAVPGAGLP